MNTRSGHPGGEQGCPRHDPWYRIGDVLEEAEKRGVTAEQVVAAIDALTRRDDALARIARLTDREREVLGHIADGMSNAAIARTVRLGEGAVKAHVSRLLGKLRCGNRVQAALLARDAGLTPTREAA